MWWYVVNPSNTRSGRCGWRWACTRTRVIRPDRFLCLWPRWLVCSDGDQPALLLLRHVCLSFSNQTSNVRRGAAALTGGGGGEEEEEEGRTQVLTGRPWGWAAPLSNGQFLKLSNAPLYLLCSSKTLFSLPSCYFKNNDYFKTHFSYLDALLLFLFSIFVSCKVFRMNRSDNWWDVTNFKGFCVFTEVFFYFMPLHTSTPQCIYLMAVFQLMKDVVKIDLCYYWI